MTLDNYFTAREAAREIGIEYMALLQRIRRGTVTTRKVGSRMHMISREEIDRLKAERTK